MYKQISFALLCPVKRWLFHPPGHFIILDLLFISMPTCLLFPPCFDLFLATEGLIFLPLVETTFQVFCAVVRPSFGLIYLKFLTTPPWILVDPEQHGSCLKTKSMVEDLSLRCNHLFDPSPDS